MSGRPLRAHDGRRLRFTDEERELIFGRYEAGTSINAIAQEVGCAHKSLTVLFGREGVAYERRWPCGEKHPNWEGGRSRDVDGYIQLRLPRDHPHYGMTNAAGAVKEHRVVMAERLGRDLYPDETVHHKNGVKDDNRPENLELMTHLHPTGQRATDQVEFATEILRRYAPDLLIEGEK